QLFVQWISGMMSTDIADDGWPSPLQIAHATRCRTSVRTTTKRAHKEMVRCEYNLFIKFDLLFLGCQEISHSSFLFLLRGRRLPCSLPHVNLRVKFTSPADVGKEGMLMIDVTLTKQWINKAPKNPANPVQRILGGHLDAKGSFPWQAKMVSRHNLTTGATLINEQWLLTTAKNLFLNHSENATAKDIAPTLTLYVGKKQLVEIEKVVLHPNYSQVDIGLIKLKQKVSVNERVMPICLPSKDYAEVGRVGYVSGWGRNANFKFTDHLKYVMLPVADQDQCIRHYEGSTVPEKKTPKSPVGVQPILNKHTFCAGMSKYQEDTCYGDAGSAFAVHDLEEDTWYAAGILSFDKSCAVAEYGVYVKVTSIQDWVQKTIAEN
uniref:Peptidase S1 domain-containing protein n=1 Tax=Pan troglodytes TaxID=9598 RepID=H2RB63_PANTR